MDWQNALSPHPEFLNVSTQNYTEESTDKSFTWKQDDPAVVAVVPAVLGAVAVNCCVTVSAIDGQLHSLALSLVMK